MTEPEIRWAKRHRFAEYAEALGLDTDQIMAVLANPPGLPGQIVMFTPDLDDETLWTAIVLRDKAGVLEVVHRLRQPGLWERMKREIERGMRDLPGDEG